MWPRIAELGLGIWLFLSPFIFRYNAADLGWWVWDYTTGAALIVLALVSFKAGLEALHWLVPLLGLAIGAHGYLNSTAPSLACGQNHLIVGLMLLIFGILPSRCLYPPRGWQELEAARNVRR